MRQINTSWNSGITLRLFIVFKVMQLQETRRSRQITGRIQFLVLITCLAMDS